MQLTFPLVSRLRCFHIPIMSTSEPLLRLVNVSKRFETPGREGVLPILDGINLELRAGESLAIIGPSGSGKSTLLHIMGTLDHPSNGEVFLHGKDLTRLKPLETAAVRNRDIGFVFQAHYLLPQCTVLENVLVPTLAKLKSRSSTKSDDPEERGRRLLARVGLESRMNHRPGELSGGERQRAAVVRALINQPGLLLADEPTGSLDHASAEQLAQLLVELNREEKVALVVVTHSPDLARRMGKVLELKDGNLVGV
jgi:lipoprotein-releasing system ATP-binding protein